MKTVKPVIRKVGGSYRAFFPAERMLSRHEDDLFYKAVVWCYIMNGEL